MQANGTSARPHEYSAPSYSENERLPPHTGGVYGSGRRRNENGSTYSEQPCLSFSCCQEMMGWSDQAADIAALPNFMRSNSIFHPIPRYDRTMSGTVVELEPDLVR